ncbi:MAG: thiamine-phosphate kinase [Candidatus Bathyarchaeia archaeon]
MKTLGEMGERSIISLIMDRLTKMPDMPLPFWDDASAIKISDGLSAVLKADLLVWKTDIPRGMTPFQAARKAVVMNFSDLGSKGVQPIAFLVSLGLPRSLDSSFVEELARGFDAAAREYGAYVIGGDTGEADEIIISGMAFGVADENRLVKRRGAQPGDILATTGLFGDTGAAFKILLEGYEAPPNLGAKLIDSIYHPRARVREGVALASSGSISASIDSSDGLAMSLHDLSRSSGVGFRVEHLPSSKEAEEFSEIHGLDLGDLVFYGGEEYEIVFTVKPEFLDAAKAVLASLGCELFEIGVATKDERILYVQGSSEKPIRAGYEHFINV